MNENSTISNAYDGKHDEYGHDLPRWMNFEHVIDIGEADPTQTATDYYGFELPNGVAMVIQNQPSHRDHPFIVYSYGDGACFHDDVEFDSLRTAIDYASQLHSGAIDPDCLRVEYTLDEYGTLCWRDFYQAAHGNIEYASRLIDQCDGRFREGFSPYACAAEDLAEGEIVDFNNCYVITDANGQDAKEIAATKIWDELGDVCIRSLAGIFPRSSISSSTRMEIGLKFSMQTAPAVWIADLNRQYIDMKKGRSTSPLFRLLHKFRSISKQ